MTDDVWSTVIGEEAARDAGATRAAAADTAAAAPRHAHPGIATGAPECFYCPVCRTITAARALAAALREALAAHDGFRPAPGRPRDPVDFG